MSLISIVPMEITPDRLKEKPVVTFIKNFKSKIFEVFLYKLYHIMKEVSELRTTSSGECFWISVTALGVGDNFGMCW